jgi:hypothetical protein
MSKPLRILGIGGNLAADLTTAPSCAQPPNSHTKMRR